MIPGWQMAAYERLRAEIVKAAVRDYQKALKKSKRIGCVCAEEIELERWFLSKWGQLLSGDNGEYILEKCRQTYNSCSFSNRKRQLPTDVQKEIYTAWKNKTSFANIHKKYGISKSQFYLILRRWDG